MVHLTILLDGLLIILVVLFQSQFHSVQTVAKNTSKRDRYALKHADLPFAIGFVHGLHSFLIRQSLRKVIFQLVKDHRG